MLSEIFLFNYRITAQHRGLAYGRFIFSVLGHFPAGALIKAHTAHLIAAFTAGTTTAHLAA